MPSPFKTFENATLLFEVPTGQTTTDDRGNVIDEIKTIRIKAFLKKADDALARQVNRTQEIDNAAWLLSGYATEPMILPASIKPNARATVTFAGHEGLFILLGPINGAYGREGIAAIQEGVTGTKISGFFQVQR